MSISLTLFSHLAVKGQSHLQGKTLRAQRSVACPELIAEPGFELSHQSTDICWMQDGPLMSVGGKEGEGTRTTSRCRSNRLGCALSHCLLRGWPLPPSVTRALFQSISHSVEGQSLGKVLSSRLSWFPVPRACPAPHRAKKGRWRLPAQPSCLRLPEAEARVGQTHANPPRLAPQDWWRLRTGGRWGAGP